MATEILVPPLGTNVDTVTLLKWHRREGEAVTAGEPLFDIETDKAVQEVEAPASGVLRGITAAEGDDVPALSRIGWLCADGEAPPNPLLSKEGAGGGQTSAAPHAKATGRDERRTSPQPSPGKGEGAGTAHPYPLLSKEGAGGGQTAASAHAKAAGRDERRTSPQPSPWKGEGVVRAFASPYARTLAASHEIDWMALRGTGPNGAVVARDVEAALAAQDNALETFTLTGVRGKIAGRMFAGAQETAPVTLMAEADATGFVALRRAVLASGVRVTYNDLLLLIVARALELHPRMGATYDGTRAIVRRTADIALAVDTERGLLAPVVRDVGSRSLQEVVAATADVVARARAGLAAPEELHGGNFTVTNLGMFGIDAFTPIVNLPETAILGVGRIRTVPAIASGRVEARQTMWLSLTFDHRLVDGGPAARFLQCIVRDIEAPASEVQP